MDKIREQVNNLAAPVLLTVVGFFLVQTYITIQKIEAKMDTYRSDLATLTTMIVAQQKQIEDLERYQKENDNWIRAWLEKYQGAVEWAKKNTPTDYD
jgi:hypothetical protein